MKEGCLKFQTLGPFLPYEIIMLKKKKYVQGAAKVFGLGPDFLRFQSSSLCLKRKEPLDNRLNPGLTHTEDFN